MTEKTDTPDTPDTPETPESTAPEEGTLAHHLITLADDAQGLSAMLNADHDPEGDIHPEALQKAAHLETSLREIIKALTHHEHLAMGPDDVWKVLNADHKKREIMPDD
jgi:hypothetical protein